MAKICFAVENNPALVSFWGACTVCVCSILLYWHIRQCQEDHATGKLKCIAAVNFIEYTCALPAITSLLLGHEEQGLQPQTLLIWFVLETVTSVTSAF